VWVTRRALTKLARSAPYERSATTTVVEMAIKNPTAVVVGSNGSNRKGRREVSDNFVIDVIGLYENGCNALCRPRLRAASGIRTSGMHCQPAAAPSAFLLWVHLCI
jgi:hypothetical protein